MALVHLKKAKSLPLVSTNGIGCLSVSGFSQINRVYNLAKAGARILISTVD
jgi:hypothetical protein